MRAGPPRQMLLQCLLWPETVAALPGVERLPVADGNARQRRWRAGKVRRPDNRLGPIR